MKGIKGRQIVDFHLRFSGHRDQVAFDHRKVSVDEQLGEGAGQLLYRLGLLLDRWLEQEREEVLEEY